MKERLNEVICITPWLDLNLTGKHIGVEGARMLSEGLKTNTTLTGLNLGCDEK